MMDISIEDVSVSYFTGGKEVQVLRHIHLFLPAGKITALVGESGSGKSILGAAVMGMLDRNASVSGKIFYGKQNVVEQPEKAWQQIRGTTIGWIAQDPIAAMDPLQKVGKQVSEGIRYRNHQAEKTEKGKVLQQLSRFGLEKVEEVYKKYPGELSGGMAQRVLSAMAAMPHPSWMVADEPTKGLDAFVRRGVCQVFRMLRDKEGTGFLLITHDLRLAEQLADYVGIMYAGEILEYGKTEEVFSHPSHPYTIHFLDAQPRRKLQPIPGMPPNLSDIPKGCIFKNRCRKYQAGLCDVSPSLHKKSENHWVRCSEEASL